MKSQEQVRPISPEKLQALTDMAADDPRGLESITDQKTAQMVLKNLYSKLTTEELLERIKHSSQQGLLMQQLFKMMHRSSAALQETILQKLEAEQGEWDGEAIEAFTDTYWKISIGEKTSREEFRSAWQEIRKAYRGLPRKKEERLSEDPFAPAEYGGWENFSPSMETIEALIAELYQKMAEKQLVAPLASDEMSVEEYVRTLPEQDRTSYYIPTGKPAADGRTMRPHLSGFTKSVAGQSFAENFMSGGRLTTAAQMVLAISAYLEARSNEKRKERYEAAVEEYEQKQRGR